MIKAKPLSIGVIYLTIGLATCLSSIQRLCRNDRGQFRMVHNEKTKFVDVIRRFNESKEFIGK
jgi:hypothetical protein